MWFCDQWHRILLDTQTNFHSIQNPQTALFHGISYAFAHTWSQFRLPLYKRVIYSCNYSTPKQDFRMPATKSIPTAFPRIPYGHMEHDSWDVLVFFLDLFVGNMFILFLVCLLLQLVKRRQALLFLKCIALAGAATWRLKMRVNVLCN